MLVKGDHVVSLCALSRRERDAIRELRRKSPVPTCQHKVRLVDTYSRADGAHAINGPPCGGFTVGVITLCERRENVLESRCWVKQLSAYRLSLRNEDARLRVVRLLARIEEGHPHIGTDQQPHRADLPQEQRRNGLHALTATRRLFPQCAHGCRRRESELGKGGIARLFELAIKPYVYLSRGCRRRSFALLAFLFCFTCFILADACCAVHLLFAYA